MVRKAARRPLVEWLRTARFALDADDHAAALPALLAAWREVRSTRIAELVDRVARKVVRPPIATRRSDSATRWHELAVAKDPLDVDRLLAAQWPGTWSGDHKCMKRLFAFPDDPRIAMAIAGRLVAARYRNAHRYYDPLYRKLEQLGDLRVVPLLEGRLAQLPAGEHAEAALVAKLHALEVPAFEADEAAELGLLEARFAAELASERAKAKGEAEFLAAIHADPDDTALRQVFADWLLERGDRRGELIALQLAGTHPRREAPLLKRSGAAWAGPLDKALEPDGRIWERGFVAGGVLRRGVPDLTSPAWSTVHTLELAPGVEQRATLARLWDLRLRSVRGLHESVALELLAGPPRPHLRELGVVIDGAAGDALAAAVPELEHLILQPEATPLELGRWPRSPLGAQIRRLTIRCGRDHDLGSWLHDLGSRFDRVEELIFEDFPPAANVWRFVATREGPGPFRRVRAEPADPREVCRVDWLRWVLTSLPANLEELVITGADYDAQLETVLARFPNVVVPWPTPGA